MLGSMNSRALGLGARGVRRLEAGRKSDAQKYMNCTPPKSATQVQMSPTQLHHLPNYYQITQLRALISQSALTISVVIDQRNYIVTLHRGH